MEAKDNRLSIDFTGLCVFVTNAPDNKLKVVLARDPDETMVHRPIVSFNVKYLSHFEGTTPMQVIQLPNGDQIASWNVSSRILRLADWEYANPKTVVICRGKDKIPTCPPDPAAEMDARWIPSLKAVTGSGSVFHDYLTNDPKPPKGKKNALAARFDCDAGYLFANLDVNRRSPMQPWVFKGAKGSHTQYLADTARLELRSLSDDNPPVVFEAYAFGDDQEPSETLELLPQEGHVEVSISNLPETLPTDMTQNQQDHFRFYYALLKGTEQEPLPVLADTPCYKAPSKHPRKRPGRVLRAEAHGVQPVKCTPGMVP